MQFGAHVSASGGLWKAAIPAKALGCDVIQIFSRSPQMWKAAPISEETVEKFQAAMKDAGVKAVYLHAPYLINLTSANNRTRFGSISMLREELERGTQLGAKAMMFHPGSAKDVGREEGIKLVIDALDRIMEGYEGTCQLLIEISAGAGEVMGDTVEEIAAFTKGAERGKEIGVCFDTQHAFASGYDLRDAKKLDELVSAFDKQIGIKQLVASHCNDSKVEFATHKDRHENIGKGFLGADAIKLFVQHPKLQHLDLILETPYDDNGADGLRPGEIELLRSFAL